MDFELNSKSAAVHNEGLSRYAWGNTATEEQQDLESLRKIIGPYKSKSDESTLAVLGQKALDVTIDGINKIPQGLTHSLSFDSMAKNVSLGFGVGAAMKAFLPATGSIGRAASAILSTAFVGKPLVESYAMALNATNQAEMDRASSHLGNAIGGMPVAFAEGIAGAKLGSKFVGEVIKLKGPATEPVGEYPNAFYDGKVIRMSPESPSNAAIFRHTHPVFKPGSNFPVYETHPVLKAEIRSINPVLRTDGISTSRLMVQNNKIGPLVGIPDTSEQK